MEREFDRVVKKATPYLIFSPKNVRDNIADYVLALWRAMENNNQTEFDMHCTNINEAIAKSDGCTDSSRQIDISNFDRRWSGLDDSIGKLRRDFIELKKEVSDIKMNNMGKKEERIKPKIENAEKIEPLPKNAEKIQLRKKRSSRNEIEQKLELLKNYLKTNSEIDNAKCREICNVNGSQASNLFHKLVKDNFIEQIGPRNRTKYILKI
jgi:hypothetical protein